MGRAERRRAQKCEQKAKTATYNLTRAQLDALVREKISGELDRVKQEATNDAINQAMILLLLEVGEMKICKVRPNYSTCSACIATQEMFNVVDDCSRCKSNTDTYELLQIGTGFWSGDYAMVQKDGKITKVSLNRVYDVKESL